MEAIRSLVPEIHGMQQKGYALGAIAKYFSEQGMDVTEATLRCYLQRAKATGGRKKRKAKTSPKESTEAASAPAVPAVVRAAGGDKPAAPATPAAPPPTKPPVAAAEAPKSARPTTESAPLRRSSFVPREDTKDL
jgi:hypothetical protein